MDFIEALRIVLDLAECAAITREEADVEGPEMGTTYFDQQDAMDIIAGVVDGKSPWTP